MHLTKKMTVLAAALTLSLAASIPAMAQNSGMSGMSGHESDEAAKHFKFMDKNKDGVVDEKEFKMMGKDYKEQFQKADTNHDGKVTPEEYKAYDDQYHPMSKMKM